MFMLRKKVLTDSPDRRDIAVWCIFTKVSIHAVCVQQTDSFHVPHIDSTFPSKSCRGLTLLKVNIWKGGFKKHENKMNKSLGEVLLGS